MAVADGARRLSCGLWLAALLLTGANGWADCRQPCPAALLTQLQQADRLAGQQNWPQARQLLQQAQQQGADHPLLWGRLGQALLQLQQPEAALAALERAVAGCPAEAALWQQLAQAAWQLGDHERAAVALQRAAELAGDDQLARQAALLWAEAGEAERALTQLEPLLERTGQLLADEELHNYVALCLRERQAGRGLRHLERWQPALQSRALFWQLRAQLLMATGAFGPAASSLRVAAALVPLPLEQQRLLADLLLQAGAPAAAARQYEALLQQQPDEAELAHRLLHSYRLALQPEQALALCERLLAGAPEARRRPLLQGRAELLYELERYDAAAQAFDQLSRHPAAAGAAWLGRASCALRQQDRTVARQALEQARRYPAQRAEADRLLRQLAQR